MKLAPFKSIVPAKDLFFSNMFDTFFNDNAMQNLVQDSTFKPGANILETDKSFEIQVALPGMKKEEVKIDLNENRLTITGERSFKKEENDGTWHYNEIREGKFIRSFILPENIVAEKIEANFKDGILEVMLPKAEPKQAKVIKIK